MYYILKLEGNHLKLWNPSKRYFVEENVSPYHSYELVYRIWKRLTAEQRRYNSKFVKIVKVETFNKLCEDFIFFQRFGWGLLTVEMREMDGSEYHCR